MFRRAKCLSFLFVLVIALAGCGTEPDTVEVTRLVEVTVEATRSVEVVIEATDTLRDLFYRYEAIVVTRVVGTEFQAETGQKILALLGDGYDGVAQVDQISWSEGVLEIELISSYPGKEVQPAVSWDVVNDLAKLLAPMTREQRLELSGSDQLSLKITTSSVVGDHPYSSMTDFDTLVQLASQELAQEEWIERSGATFR